MSEAPIEILHLKCACGTPLDVQWCNGVISEPHFVLIADYVMCIPCSDAMDKDLEEINARTSI